MYLTKYKTVSAIISEYNPFHKGHEYHITQTRELTGSTFVVALMSGAFVQRGEPAVFDKYTRTLMALNNGADVVIELPVVYSLASATGFAEGAIALLNSLNCIDYLSFGSECGNIDNLKSAAHILNSPSVELDNMIKAKLKNGLSYPRAVCEAMSSSDDSNVFHGSNNILGIEYLKALEKYQSRIEAVTIPRKDNSYADKNLNTNSEYTSALSVRNALKSSLPYQEYIPENIQSLFEAPIFLDNFSNLMYYKLISLKDEGFEQYEDVSEELSHKIIKNIPKFTSISEFVSILKSKNYTYTRIQRCLAHILLDIKKGDSQIQPEYARILGFKKDAEELLGVLKKSSSVPLVTKLADAQINYSLKKDIFASELYSQISGRHQNEYTSSLIIV